MVAVLRIVPPGDNVALGEMMWRVLSASLTPRRVFGGGDARKKLARRAFRWTRAVWGLLLAIPSSLAVEGLDESPRARRRSPRGSEEGADGPRAGLFESFPFFQIGRRS